MYRVVDKFVDCCNCIEYVVSIIDALFFVKYFRVRYTSEKIVKTTATRSSVVGAAKDDDV